MLELAKEIVGGRRLTREEDCSFLLEADINELCEGADYIRKNLCGTRADLCAIINGKSGACSENCKFCSQSAHHHTACQAGDFIDEEAILSGCREAWEQGVDRYCIVTAGRAIKDEDFEKALHAYKKMHEEFPDMILCASHGFVSEEKLKQLKEAGYHCSLVNARFVKPLDTEMLDHLTEQHKLIVTIEENVRSGGFGEHVTEYLMRTGSDTRVQILALPDEYIEHGNGEVLRKDTGLDVETMTSKIRKLYETL